MTQAHSRRRSAASILAIAALAATGLVVPTAAHAASPNVVVNEVYGGGGNNGALFNRDFVELYNGSDVAVSLAGWSVEYASAGGATWASTPLTGSIAGKGYLLIGMATGANLALPGFVADIEGTSAMSGTAGKVRVVDAALTPVDLVGYGSTATPFEGTAPAPGTSNSTSVSRTNGADTDQNSLDFTAGTPTPQKSGGTPDPDPDPEPEPVPTAATIAQVQGTGEASPLAGQTVTTRGVVTASYPTGGFLGYVIQTPGTGGAVDLSTHLGSEAVFVYSPAAPIQPLGAYVEVTGVVSEFGGASAGAPGLTEITASAVVPVAEAFVPPIAAVLAWPTAAAQRESLESMLIAPQGDFTVTNTFSTNQFGEVGLATGTTPLQQPTDVGAPFSAEAAAVAADNAVRSIVLDDGATTNFLSAANQSQTPPYISLVEPVIVGAAATFTAPVIADWRNGVWKFNPVSQTVGDGSGTDGVLFENTRTAAPADVGGDVSIASFNVLNYFTTLGAGVATCTSFKDRTGDGVTVNTGCAQRGAWDPADLERQQTKIVEAINALDADVVGLMEIENSATLGETPDEATATLVAALNADAREDRWAYVPSSSELPASGMDVITNAIIYQPAAVERVGDPRALGTLSNDDQAFGNAREPIAQVFEPVGGGEEILFVVNHFKSKGSAGPWPNDTDQGDGQGAGNQSRIRQAEALRDWVASIQGDVDAVALAGDFNSYGKEDPLERLYAAGYVDAEELFDLPTSSYSFSGLSGSLDHILLNSAAADRATGADIWNINSGEALATEYSRYNYHGTLFYAPDAYRSSDHDPIKVGMDAGAVDSTTTLALSRTAFVYGVDRSVQATATVAAENGDPVTGGVEFLVDGAVIATGSVNAGVATATLVLPGVLTSGSHAVQARYVGSAEVAASASAATTITVRAAGSATVLLALPPIHVNRLLPATLTAWIVVENGDTAVGTVEFREGTTVIGTATVKASGAASFTLPSRIASGTHRYTATFVPTDTVNYTGSTSSRTTVIAIL